MRAGRATSHFPPPLLNRQNLPKPQQTTSPILTPALLLLPHCWGELAVLATQSQGDITCACDCEARIASLPLPTVKKILLTAQKHCNNGNSSAVISISVPTRRVRFSPCPTRTPVCLRRPPDTPSTSNPVGGVRGRQWTPVFLPHTISQFRIICRTQHPPFTSPS